MAASANGTTEVFGYKIDFMNELGRGSFGTVYKGYGENNSIVALKKICTGTKTNRENASREALKFQYMKDHLLQTNDHITRIYDVKYLQHAVWIVMEFCDLGDLNQFFKSYYSQLTFEVMVKLMKQIMNGIAFLHDRNIVHRDIKPGNILLASRPRQNVVVKLGDFGLSKILDPDSLTSAMSSNVGTLSFKAPEFWNTRPDADGKVKYHRNVDVYAAGLTFAAMLQAQPGRTLVPKAEGSLQSAEAVMPVGLAAHNRMVNRQPDIVIVKDKETDTNGLRKVKELIRGMTHISERDRFSASKVIKKFEEPLLSRHSTTTVDPFSDAICFVNGHLVYRGTNTNFRHTITVNGNNSQLQTEWETACDHYLPYGLLTACRPTGASSDEELLAEGCPHPNCQVIRIYDLSTGDFQTVYDNVEPHKMCTGAENTVLVCDWKTNSILVLVPADGLFRCIHKLDLHPHFLPVQGMCYSSLCDAVVLSKFDEKQVLAIKLETGETLWQITEFADLVDWIELQPEDVCSTPNGWICVANRANVLVLNAFDGAMVSFLDVANAMYMDIPNVNSLEMEALEMLPDDMNEEISSFPQMPMSRDPAPHGTPLNTTQNPITYFASESSSSTNKLSATSQNDVISLYQCVHKIMWCEREHKVAVRQGEQTIITCNVTLLPTGNVVIDTEQ